MYGETGAGMRAEFAALLRQHRIQQRLVGATLEEREVLGGLIRTYRQTVLVWLGQAMRAASPLAFSNMRRHSRTRSGQWVHAAPT